MVFSASKENSANYIYMHSKHTAKFKHLTIAFWIKVPHSADEFTLVSYAVPSQVNEFSVHFGTTGIWVYLHGIKRYYVILFFLETQ